MPQDSATPNHMFGFKGSHCASPNYNRVRYKKWPWVSFLVATVCIGIIFFIAGSPANIYRMKGGALVLCSILLFLGSVLLVPSTIIVIYLGVYFLMVYFKCSSRKCCGRPIQWAKRLNAESPEDQIFLPHIIRDENDNPTDSTKNKRKQEQSSASRNRPKQLSVNAVMADANNVNHVTPDRTDKRLTNVAPPNAQQSVYSVQTDVENTLPQNAYYQQRPEPNHVNHNHVAPGHPGHRSRDNRGISYDRPLTKRGRPDGVTDGNVNAGIDNASYNPEEDDDYDRSHRQSYNQPSVHSYGRSPVAYSDPNRSLNGPYDSRGTPRSVYGVTRSPNLGVGPRTANNRIKSQDPPSFSNPPVDARVNVVNHPVERSVPNSSPKSSRSNDARDRARKKPQRNDSTAIEMDELSNPQRKTLAEHAKNASKRPPPQVRGYQSTRRVSGYLETSMTDSRSYSGSENFNSHNNHYRSRTSKVH